MQLALREMPARRARPPERTAHELAGLVVVGPLSGDGDILKTMPFSPDTSLSVEPPYGALLRVPRYAPLLLSRAHLTLQNKKIKGTRWEVRPVEHM